MIAAFVNGSVMVRCEEYRTLVVTKLPDAVTIEECCATMDSGMSSERDSGIPHIEQDVGPSEGH